MNILKQLFLALLLIAIFPSQALAAVGRIELLTFQSMTLTDEEFLAGKKNASPVTTAGELRFPRKKMKHFPVVVLVHGSGGVSGYVDDWAQELNNMGVAVFILDSFTGRGLYKLNNDQGQLGRLAMIVDAYRALDLLAQHQHIDDARIAVMGFSRGGQAALYASLKRFQRLQGSGSTHEFAAYIPFYPACNTSYIEEEDIVNKPIRIFHGGADNYSPVAPCSAYVERLRKNGKDIILHEYAGAHHVFDYKKLTTPVILPKAQTTRACQLEENKSGIIVNTQSGQPFTYNDPCVGFGPTIAFNQNAYDKAKQTLLDFISSVLLSTNKQ